MKQPIIWPNVEEVFLENVKQPLLPHPPSSMASRCTGISEARREAVVSKRASRSSEVPFWRDSATLLALVDFIGYNFSSSE